MATKRAPSLEAALKKADPVVRYYVSELEARNAKRQREIVKLEADKVERDGKIEALKKEMKKGKPPMHAHKSASPARICGLLDPLYSQCTVYPSLRSLRCAISHLSQRPRDSLGQCS